MRFVTLTTFQLFLLALVTGAIAGGVVLVHNMYRDYSLLPQVHTTPGGECVKVVNFENGHAFNCTDVNVLLRRYRTVIAPAS
jgi:hypothetical protein